MHNLMFSDSGIWHGEYFTSTSKMGRFIYLRNPAFYTIGKRISSLFYWSTNRIKDGELFHASLPFKESFMSTGPTMAPMFFNRYAGFEDNNNAPRYPIEPPFPPAFAMTVPFGDAPPCVPKKFWVIVLAGRFDDQDFLLFWTDKPRAGENFYSPVICCDNLSVLTKQFVIFQTNYTQIFTPFSIFYSCLTLHDELNVQLATFFTPSFQNNNFNSKP